ncbi:MAG: accessory factor UbiK family protein [Gammaproteobacteria bacterium]|nr:accessory factor UbiK family protein [Gammaproteobacteria bacterium]
MKPDPSLFEDIARRLAANLPDSLGQAKNDMERNFRALLEGALSRLDLVSREEFDAQTALLRRTRERLDALAEQVEQLERAKNGSGNS